MKMRTYFLASGKHTDNSDSRKVTMTNKVIAKESSCAICSNKKSRFLKQK